MIVLFAFLHSFFLWLGYLVHSSCKHTNFWNVKQRCVHTQHTCLIFVFVSVWVCKFTTNGTSVDHMCTAHCILFSNLDEVHQIAKHIIISMLIDFDFSFGVMSMIFSLSMIAILEFCWLRIFTSSPSPPLVCTRKNGGAIDKNCGAKEKRFSFEWLHLYTLKFIK